MSENIRYYIPTIEEFHVGFEYELLKKKSVYDNEWKFEVIKRVFDVNVVSNSYDWARFNIDLKDKEIRVKYLDWEDVKASEILNQDEFTIMFISNICSSDGKPHIGVYNKLLNQCIFSGIVNNKSELRKLMKQLNIKNK